MLISEGVSDYLKYLRVRRGSAKTTLSTYNYVLQDFYKTVGDTDTWDLTVKTIDTYAYNLSLRNYSNKTHRNKLIAVKGLVTYLHRYKLTELKPDEIELPKEQPTEANFLTEKEQKKLLAGISDTRDKAMILTLLTSGVRVSEFINLKTSDLYKKSLLVRKGKGGKPRITFITTECRKAVDDYLKIRNIESQYLFPNPTGARISRVVVARKVSHYANKTFLGKKVTTHTLRHSMATTMLKRGARVEDVQKILGHTSIKTTLIYLHFTNFDLEKTYNRVMNKA